MKAIITAFFTVVFLVACSVQAPVNSHTSSRKGTSAGQQGISNSVSLPNGTYYIVQVSSGDAITPQGVKQITNEIHLKPFNKSGMQKWIVKRQNNGRYLFLPLGNPDLYFTTFSDKPSWTAITGNKIGDTFAVKSVSGTNDYFTIQSQYYAGDALRDFLVGGVKEIKFVPLENNAKFYWKFIPAE